MQIKSRKDAQEFVYRVREFSLLNHYDPAIREFRISGDRYVSASMNRPAWIDVRVLSDGTWQRKARGPDWEDQAWTDISDPAGWVYAHRAGINALLRIYAQGKNPWDM